MYCDKLSAALILIMNLLGILSCVETMKLAFCFISVHIPVLHFKYYTQEFHIHQLK